MKTKTYFFVLAPNGVDLQDFCNVLNYPVEEVIVRKSKRVGATYKFGYNEEFNIDINEMVRKSLKLLFGQEDKLYELKKKYGLEYSLERVVVLEPGEVNPVLSLDPDIVEFLYLTETQDDLDYYV